MYQNEALDISKRESYKIYIPDACNYNMMSQITGQWWLGTTLRGRLKPSLEASSPALMYIRKLVRLRVGKSILARGNHTLRQGIA